MRIVSQNFKFQLNPSKNRNADQKLDSDLENKELHDYWELVMMSLI